MNAYQVRASVSKFILDGITLDSTLRNPLDNKADPTKDRVANEWRLEWDEEQESPTADQAFRRMVQIDRLRNDGDVITLEIETGSLFQALGLTKPGVFVSVPVLNYPNATGETVGYVRIGRLESRGFKMLPDEARRINQLRAVATIAVDYVLN